MRAWILQIISTLTVYIVVYENSASWRWAVHNLLACTWQWREDGQGITGNEYLITVILTDLF